jgi:hypothetical protein
MSAEGKEGKDERRISSYGASYGACPWLDLNNSKQSNLKRHDRTDNQLRLEQLLKSLPKTSLIEPI